MLTITLLYSMEGTNIANLISEELSGIKSSWKFDPYPLISKKDKDRFCSSLSNGSLKTDIIIFLCTDDFYQNNIKELSKLRNISENKKYRFSWVMVGQGKKCPENIPCDVEIAVNSILCCDDSDEKHTLLSKVSDYLQLVDITVKRQKEFEEQRRTNQQKFYKMFIPLCVAYFGMIISAISVMQVGPVHFRSSAELLVLATGFTAIVIFICLFVFIILIRRKRLQEKESKEFDRELTMSLSNSLRKVKRVDEYIDGYSELISDNPFLASNALDLFFLVNKMKHDTSHEDNTYSAILAEKNKRDISFLEDTEITKAIGDNTYLPLGHLKFNWKQMKGYYDISKGQAKTSFWCAITISFIGMALITFAILSPMIPCLRMENSLIPIIGSIGGAVVELFAGTILVVYIKTLSQMNLYHKALSGYQRYLSCINLVSQISSLEKQDQLYEEIIREEMKKDDIVVLDPSTQFQRTNKQS